MKTVLQTLCIACITFIMAHACTQKLPSYQDIHGNTVQGNGNKVPQEKPDDKNDSTIEEVYIDGELSVEFQAVPDFGSEGQIKIYSNNGTLVDMIDMKDVSAQPVQMTDNLPYNTTIDFIGPESLKRWRAVYYKPVRVDGKKVLIRPHSNTLEYGKNYYLTIDRTAFVAEGFKGISEGEMTFRTKSAPSSKGEFTVSKTGEADFRTIQGAIDWAYSCGPNAPVTISIKNGTYEEAIFARQNNNITFKGESRDGVILQYCNAEELANGVGGSISTKAETGESIGKSGGRAVILFENCKGIRFENMTMKNTYGKPGQAEVIYNNSNGAYTLTFINCSLISLQDTFNTKGYCWMYNCLVEGDCDFIWGSPKTCLFEKCEIRAAGDGYIVQARCMDSKDKGFVFLDCNLTKADEVKAGTMYLARSSGSADYYDNVTYINCRMSDAIAPSGWYGKPVPNPATSSASSGWKEFRSTDPEGGELSVSSRLQASYQLTEAEYSAGFKNREAIFSDSEVGTSWLVL